MSLRVIHRPITTKSRNSYIQRLYKEGNKDLAYRDQTSQAWPIAGVLNCWAAGEVSHCRQRKLSPSPHWRAFIVDDFVHQ
ncbi:hypothetical protein O9929_14555 [Vibrio lentus]|nr:hypothetical protein [Vibrio lentus]